MVYSCHIFFFSMDPYPNNLLIVNMFQRLAYMVGAKSKASLLHIILKYSVSNSEPITKILYHPELQNCKRNAINRTRLDDFFHQTQYHRSTTV